jgi:hypothetical protein
LKKETKEAKDFVKSMMERRKDQRIDNNIPVKICQVDGDIVTETKNISRSGAYCCVTQNIVPMTRLKIHLLLTHGNGGTSKTHTISCEGVVVRSELAADEKHYNIAIFFSDITNRDATIITDYVNGF